MSELSARKSETEGATMSSIVEIQNFPTIEPKASPGLALLQIAAQRGAAPEELEKWMALHERWEANEARKAFVRAMAEFKSELIVVQKDGHVSYPGKDGKPKTEYDHETLWAVVSAAVPRMGKFGLSHDWELAQAEGGVTVTCVVTHEEGHSKRVPLSAPRDESGGKNTIQSIGSTIRYLERYTLMAALGLAAKAKDKDDDGRGSQPPACISVDQITALTDLARERGVGQERFFTYMKVKSLAEIPIGDYNKAEAAMKSMGKKP